MVELTRRSPEAWRESPPTAVVTHDDAQVDRQKVVACRIVPITLRMTKPLAQRERPYALPFTLRTTTPKTPNRSTIFSPSGHYLRLRHGPNLFASSTPFPTDTPVRRRVPARISPAPPAPPQPRSSTTRYTFTAQEAVVEIAGAFYMDGRWYDSLSGQFYSADPIQYDTANTYRYVGNNPTGATDPSGLQEVSQTQRRIESPEFWQEMRDNLVPIPGMPPIDVDLNFGSVELPDYSHLGQEWDAREMAQTEAENRRYIERELAMSDPIRKINAGIRARNAIGALAKIAEEKAREEKAILAMVKAYDDRAEYEEFARASVSEHAKNGELKIRAGRSKSIRISTAGGYFDVKVSVSKMREETGYMASIFAGKSRMADYDVDVRFYPNEGVEGTIKLASVGRSNASSLENRAVRAVTTDAGWRVMNGFMGERGRSIFKADDYGNIILGEREASNSGYRDPARMRFPRGVTTRGDGFSEFVNSTSDKINTRRFIIGAKNTTTDKWLGFTSITIEEHATRKNRDLYIVVKFNRHAPNATGLTLKGRNTAPRAFDDALIKYKR